MQEAYVDLNGVKTKISTWGKWIEESPEDINDVVVIIPGNPGVNGFYNFFATAIHNKLGYPVWCIGHAGHSAPSDAIRRLEGKEDHYGLKGQIEHKVEFFKKYIPVNARVHLVAHSIGSYMSLEILEHPDVKEKVEDVYLLFPTIEYMSETNNGKFLINFIRPALGLILYLTWLITVFPNFLATAIIYVGMFVYRIPTFHFNSVKELINPDILRRVFYLAIEEMEDVKERNNDVIRRNVGKIRFYYGAKDGWTPESYRDRLKADIPGVNIDVVDINHTFVFKQSEEVGNTVADWITARE